MCGAGPVDLKGVPGATSAAQSPKIEDVRSAQKVIYSKPRWALGRRPLGGDKGGRASRGAPRRTLCCPRCHPNTGYLKDPGARLKDPGVILQDLVVPSEDPGALLKHPGVRLEDPRALFKDPGVILQAPVVLLEDPGVLLKGPGVLLKDTGTL